MIVVKWNVPGYTSFNSNSVADFPLRDSLSDLVNNSTTFMTTPALLCHNLYSKDTDI